MGKMSLKFFVLSLICACLCGCETFTDSVKKFFEPDEQAGLEEAASAAVYVPDGPRIRPGVGLIIQVAIPTQRPQDMSVMVDQKGEVTLPYLLTEPVKCDGLSLEAFRQKLVKRYQQYIHQPQVTVVFAPVPPDGVSPYGTVRVMGEVVREGPVNLPPTMDLTVTKALQAAGGLKQFANKRKVQVAHREKDGQLVLTLIDLEEIGKKGRIDLDKELKAGDVVYVYESYW